jgi:hypothetical protein
LGFVHSVYPYLKGSINDNRKQGGPRTGDGRWEEESESGREGERGLNDGAWGYASGGFRECGVKDLKGFKI